MHPGEEDPALALCRRGHLGEERTDLTFEQTGQWLVMSLTSVHFLTLTCVSSPTFPDPWR
jgi:hypothetical protein